MRDPAELDVVGCSCASRGVWLDVMGLEERGLAAAATATDDRTARFIALPHCTPNSRRYVAAHGLAVLIVPEVLNSSTITGNWRQMLIVGLHRDDCDRSACLCRAHSPRVAHSAG